MNKKRKFYSVQLKERIARGYHDGTLSSKEIEAQGIPMNNVHRWVAELFGPGGRKAAAKPTKPTKPTDEPHVRLLERTGATPTTTPDSPATIAPEVRDIRSLTKRELKRGENGRYLPVVKASVSAALKTMSVPEVHEITGITEATLYLWKTPSKKKASAPGTALVPINGHEHKDDLVPVRKAELLINPSTTDALLSGIRKSEGFANLDKAVKQLKAAHRSGLIDDYDEIDLRMLLGFRQLTGGGLRSRK